MNKETTRAVLAQLAILRDTDPAVKDHCQAIIEHLAAKLSALPPLPLATAKLNQQHDYITCKVIFGDGHVNLTRSRYGFKVSGKGVSVPQMNALLKAADAYVTLKSRDIGSVGTAMELMAALVRTTRDADGLVEALNAR